VPNDGCCSIGEDPCTEPVACGLMTTCGNGICECDEDSTSCYADCACGNGTCQPREVPHILFQFDTSGSMAFESCDPASGSDVDDTVECPGTDVDCATCAAEGCGNLLPDDSRSWKVKTAITDVVSTHPNAVYALARYHMTPSPFFCPGGGWVGPNVACFGAPLGQGQNAADILVEFAPGNETDLLEWMDFQDNHAGVAPDTGCTLCADCGGGCDKELRPTGTTPIAGALFSVREYIDAARTLDPLGGCRPHAVILLTDGKNGCNDPNNPTDPDPSPEQAAALCADGVPVYVIGFAAQTFAAILDPIAAAGCGPSCNRTGCDGQAILLDSRADLETAMGQIIDAQDINACGEDPAKCLADCCNADGLCDPGETGCCVADSCADACGDGCCTGIEDLLSCFADCGG